MMMSLLSWMRCFVAMMFMHTSFNCQRADGNKTIPDEQIKECGCACYDGSGQIYNLSPLQRDDGKPRFTVKDSRGFAYSYNPCRSFWLGGEQSDCNGDVAICMWAVNNSSYQKIGRQSAFPCSRDDEYWRPDLVYTNLKRFPHNQAIVHLECDESKKTPEEAGFRFIGDDKNPWVFVVSSNCACPNGCPNEVTTASPASPASLEPPADDANKPELQFILPICALSFLVFAIPLFIYRHRIMQCIRGQNDNDVERQPLNRGYVRVDYAANDLNGPDQGRRPDNPHDVPQPSSESPSPPSNTLRVNKNLNVRSNRNQNA